MGGHDLFPTFCEWAGINKTSLPKGLEGGGIVSLLANEGRGEVKRSRDELVFHFPHYHGDAPHSAIFLGDLKLLHFYEDRFNQIIQTMRGFKVFMVQPPISRDVRPARSPS